MTVDQIIAVSSCVGTFLAALATLWTVREMKKQREATYQPQIVLSRVSFECTAEPATGGLLPDLWRKKANNKNKPDEPCGLIEGVLVPAHNIGTGAAKDVDITWSFPIDDLVEQINKLAQRTLTKAYFVYDRGMLSIKSDVVLGHTIMWENERKNSIDYMLPASIEENPRMVRLPTAYTYLTSALIFLALRDKDNPKGLPEIPTIQIAFEYTDIGGKKHKVSHQIVFQLEAASQSFFVGSLISGQPEPSC